MLRTCTRDELDQYMDFAYELAGDLTKSSYPTYCDGIKTKDMFVERSLKAFETETEHMLIFSCDDEVQGLIHYYWIPDDHYLSICSFNINRNVEQALSEFLSYIGDHFKGYDVVLGFPAENHAAVKYLSESGFECIENDYNNTAFLDSIYQIPENVGLVQINKENCERFVEIHDGIEGDMYWNSERILADLDNWVIFVKETDGEAQGAVYYTSAGDRWFEIFGIDTKNGKYDSELFKLLLNTALSDAKNRNGRFMTFFCDEDYEEETIRCGFKCVGKYLCYKTKL